MVTRVRHLGHERRRRQLLELDPISDRGNLHDDEVRTPVRLHASAGHDEESLREVAKGHEGLGAT